MVANAHVKSFKSVAFAPTSPLPPPLLRNDWLAQRQPRYQIAQVLTLLLFFPKTTVASLVVAIRFGLSSSLPAPISLGTGQQHLAIRPVGGGGCWTSLWLALRLRPFLFQIIAPEICHRMPWGGLIGNHSTPPLSGLCEPCARRRCVSSRREMIKNVLLRMGGGGGSAPRDMRHRLTASIHSLASFVNPPPSSWLACWLGGGAHQRPKLMEASHIGPSQCCSTRGASCWCFVRAATRAICIRSGILPPPCPTPRQPFVQTI